MPCTFGLLFDFRNPEPWAQPLTRRWGEIIDLVAWSERLGFRAVWLAEHHFLPDDHVSSTMTVAAALAMRTELMLIGTNVMVLPVHAPLRLAEECLTVDALSGGRLRLGVGLGYRPEELTPFGVTMRQRRTRFEANLAQLRRAFRGETIEDVRVAPAPVRDGGPEVWIGATSEVGVERAARLGDGFLCMRRSFVDVYNAARTDMGAGPGRIAHGHQWIVAEDPERAYARVGEHAQYLFNEYRDHGAMGPVGAVPAADSPADVIARGFFELLDADAAATRIAGELAAGPVEEAVLWGMLPGEPVSTAAERLEYVARRVIPRFGDQPADSEPGVRSGED